MKSPLRSSHRSPNLIHLIQTSLPITITITWPKLIPNWWAKEKLYYQRLSRAQWKYQAQQGGSMATLWVGLSPLSGHQPALRNFCRVIYLPDLTWYLWWTSSMRGGKGWISQKGDQRSDPQSSTEQANCKYGDQWSIQDDDPQRPAEQTTATRAHTHDVSWQGKPLWPPHWS